jgi:hypothetical protein
MFNGDERAVHLGLLSSAEHESASGQSSGGCANIRGRSVDEREKQKFIRLYEHAVALEIELARYAAKYGVTDEARRLLVNSPLGEPPET